MYNGKYMQREKLLILTYLEWFFRGGGTEGLRNLNKILKFVRNFFIH